jgi:hypothetical protein
MARPCFQPAWLLRRRPAANADPAAAATTSPPSRLQMQRLQARENEDGSGSLVNVAMDQESFRDLISVLAD